MPPKKTKKKKAKEQDDFWDDDKVEDEPWSMPEEENYGTSDF